MRHAIDQTNKTGAGGKWEEEDQVEEEEDEEDEGEGRVDFCSNRQFHISVLERSEQNF